MKTKIVIAVFALLSCFFYACEDSNYPDGLPEYENFYYAGFLPWNNTKVSVNKSQTALIKLPVQFHSEFIRSYDVDVKYFLRSTGIASPAVVGVDFEIVDKTGNKVQGTDGIYTLHFPQAKKGVDTIYVKPLNNPVAGTRTINIDLCAGEDVAVSRINNQTNDYTVSSFSQAYRRPIELK